MTTLQLGISNPSSATLALARHYDTEPGCNEKIQLSLTELVDDHDLLSMIHRNIPLNPMPNEHIALNIGQLQLFDKLIHSTRSISLSYKHNPRSLRSGIDLIQQ